MSNLELYSVITGSASVVSLIISIVAIRTVIKIKKQVNINDSTSIKQSAVGFGNKQKMNK